MEHAALALKSALSTLAFDPVVIIKFKKKVKEEEYFISQSYSTIRINFKLSMVKEYYEV